MVKVFIAELVILTPGSEGDHAILYPVAPPDKLNIIGIKADSSHTF